MPSSAQLLIGKTLVSAADHHCLREEATIVRTPPVAYIAAMIAVALEAGIIAVMLGVVTSAHGQSYPNKPVRVLTTPPGGGAELLARYITQGISSPLGQPMIVDS